MANNCGTQQEMFGGDWTERKLYCLQKYLKAYTTIFHRNEKARFYRTHYVDAFAGTGRMQLKDMPLAEFTPELAEDQEQYAKGSATRALEVEPPFDHYLFIERDPVRALELEQLKEHHPQRASDITVLNADASEAITTWCKETDWTRNRAVLFLDPFGMDVEWELLQTIGSTCGIDLWYLCPLFAINRLLMRDGRLPESWSERLTKTFGTSSWFEEFYTTEETQLPIAGWNPSVQIIKTANQERIKNFLLGRLRTVFVSVAEPLMLYNSRSCPLYMLIFAAGNEKAANAGMNIARHIIES